MRFIQAGLFYIASCGCAALPELSLQAQQDPAPAMVAAFCTLVMGTVYALVGVFKLDEYR